MVQKKIIHTNRYVNNICSNGYRLCSKCVKIIDFISILSPRDDLQKKKGSASGTWGISSFLDSWTLVMFYVSIFFYSYVIFLAEFLFLCSLLVFFYFFFTLLFSLSTCFPSCVFFLVSSFSWLFALSYLLFLFF